MRTFEDYIKENNLTYEIYKGICCRNNKLNLVEVLNKEIPEYYVYSDFNAFNEHFYSDNLINSQQLVKRLNNIYYTRNSFIITPGKHRETIKYIKNITNEHLKKVLDILDDYNCYNHDILMELKDMERVFMFEELLPDNTPEMRLFIIGNDYFTGGRQYHFLIIRHDDLTYSSSCQLLYYTEELHSLLADPKIKEIFGYPVYADIFSHSPRTLSSVSTDTLSEITKISPKFINKHAKFIPDTQNLFNDKGYLFYSPQLAVNYFYSVICIREHYAKKTQEITQLIKSLKTTGAEKEKIGFLLFIFDLHYYMCWDRQYTEFKYKKIPGKQSIIPLDWDKQYSIHDKRYLNSKITLSNNGEDSLKCVLESVPIDSNKFFSLVSKTKWPQRMLERSEKANTEIDMNKFAQDFDEEIFEELGFDVEYFG